MRIRTAIALMGCLTASCVDPAMAQAPVTHLRLTWDFGPGRTVQHVQVTEIPVFAGLAIPLGPETEWQIRGRVDGPNGPETMSRSTDFSIRVCRDGGSVRLCAADAVSVGPEMWCEYIDTSDGPPFRIRTWTDLPVRLARDEDADGVWRLAIGPPTVGESRGGCANSSPAGTVPQRSGSARLEIASEPPGARIWIGYPGESALTQVGTTDSAVALPFEPPGERVVVFVVRDGFLPWRHDLDVSASDPPPIRAHLLPIRRPSR